MRTGFSRRFCTTSSFVMSKLRRGLDHHGPGLDRDPFDRLGHTPPKKTLERGTWQEPQKYSRQRLSAYREPLNVEPKVAALAPGRPTSRLALASRWSQTC